MIRVLELLTTTTLGGGPGQVWHLVRRLPRGEFDVAIAGPADRRFAQLMRDTGVPTHALALDELAALPLTLGATLALIRRLRPDVLHTHGKGAGLYGRLAARLVGVPAVHTFHGLHHEGYGRPARAVYLALERLLCRLSHTVIHVSVSQAQEAAGLGLAPAGRSATIVNGIDAEELEARSPWAREDLGLAADALVVGSVARFDPVKRLDALVHAVARLVPSRPRVVLLLVGAGPEQARLARLVARLGVERHVHLTGTVGLHVNPYPAMDLYATVSAKEGLPLAPLEAMAASLPVVATDVPGHRDLVDDGRTGLLVPAGDARALDAALAALLDDPDRRRRLGQAGRARVLREFGIGPMVDATAGVYRAATASCAGRASRAASSPSG